MFAGQRGKERVLCAACAAAFNQHEPVRCAVCVSPIRHCVDVTRGLAERLDPKGSKGVRERAPWTKDEVG
jgi:predicted amidophosphoribosyltransferase